MGKAGKIILHKGEGYDSYEEVWFSMWLEELKDAGYIKHWERNNSEIQITPSVYSSFKQGSKVKTQTILQSFSYTPDFILKWDRSAKGLLFNQINSDKITQPFIADKNLVSYVEIKPAFDKNNMTRLFRQVQKFLYHTKSLYVNLIIPQKLFEKTFTPGEFLKTKTGKDRKIKWELKDLNNFLKKDF